MKGLRDLFLRASKGGMAVDPPPSPLARAGWQPTHRHKKGGLYRLICYGTLEADRSPVAIYDDAIGSVWVRAASEFDDGRFTPVNVPPVRAVDPAGPP